MIDIPILKQEKETLQLKIQVCNNKIDILKTALENETNIIITSKSIKKYKLCLTTPELQEKAEEVANELEKSIVENKLKLEEENIKLNETIKKLDNINETLKRARANVK